MKIEIEWHSGKELPKHQQSVVVMHKDKNIHSGRYVENWDGFFRQMKRRFDTQYLNFDWTEAELKNLTKTDLTCPCGGTVEVRLARKQEQIVACCVCTKCRCYSQNTVPHFELKNSITEAKEKWKYQYGKKIKSINIDCDKP